MLLLGSGFSVAQTFEENTVSSTSTTETKEQPIIHTLKTGESLMTISYKYYGTHQKWQVIVDANPNVDPMLLTIGQSLTIPLEHIKDKSFIKTAVVVAPKEVVPTVSEALPVPEVEEKVEISVIPPKVEFETPTIKVVNFDKKEEIKQEVVMAKLAVTVPVISKVEVAKVEVDTSANDVFLERIRELEEQNLAQQKELEQFQIDKSKEIAELNQHHEKVAQDLKFNNKELVATISAKERMYYQKGEDSNDRIETLLDENNNLRRKNENFKNEIVSIDKKLHETKQSYVSTLVLNEKLQDKNEDLNERKFASLNLKDNLVKTQQEYDELHDEFIKAKEDNISFEKKFVDYKLLEKKLSKAKDSLEDYKQDITDLSSKVSSFENQKSKIQTSHPLYLKSLLSKAHSDIIREKTRLLTERIWVEKNKNFGKCVVQINQNETKNLKAVYRDFVLYLNEQFGSENVVISQSEDKLIFKMPGKLVWGVKDPSISSGQVANLYKINNYLNQLPVKNLTIVGHSKYSAIKDKFQKVHDGDIFILKQAIKVQDYFIKELGWNPSKVNSLSAGFQPDELGKGKKSFEFQIELHTGKDNNTRSIAAIIKKDEALSSISDDLLEDLSEPKFSKIQINQNNIDVNLGHHYFFTSGGSSLTGSGKVYVDKLVKMFSLSSDVEFDIMWIPGRQDKDSNKNVRKSLREIASMKKYLADKYPSFLDKTNFGFSNRHHNLNEGLTYAQDKHNDRLVFRVIPIGINISRMDEINDI